jgi:F-type H+-transporting ATPase subunit delta
MLDIAVARKYANALFEASKKVGNTVRVAEDMEGLSALRADDPAFLKFLISPEVLNEHKHAFIKAVFESRLDPMAVNFLRLLVDKGRIGNLPAICEEFLRLSEESRGLIRARVETVFPLDDDQRRRLKTELDGISGMNVLIEERLNPALVGGIVVLMGDQIIDRSLRRGLKRMSEALLGAE